MIIIGITGTLGAGKGTVVEYLLEKGFEHYSARAFIYEEIDKRGLERNRDNLIAVANELAGTYEPSYIAEQLFERAQKSRKNVVIESIRRPAEIESLKSKGTCYIFAVDADSKLRYERILKRKSKTDMVSYEKFIEQEKSEMQTTDPNKQNIGKCIEMANYKFMNDDTILKLHEKVKKVLEEINL